MSSKSYIPPSVFCAIAGLFVGVMLFSGCPDPAPTEVENGDTLWTWKVDTLFYDLPQGSPPDQINIQTIWGSSPHDVWGVALSDIITGELWHYDGIKWRVVHGWPYTGIDAEGSYLNDMYGLAGIDSANVFFFGSHEHDSTINMMVLKWNGTTWTELPWLNNEKASGIIHWGVRQNRNGLWGMSNIGRVVQYDLSTLRPDSQLTSFLSFSPNIAALDNGEVFVNVWSESTMTDIFIGTRTQLFRRRVDGLWSLIEDKFMAGTFDGSGLGRGMYSVGDRLFTGNQGLWERIGDSWVLQLRFRGLSGTAFVNDQDLFVYSLQDLWRNRTGTWKKIQVSIPAKYGQWYFYGQGWSNGKEIFIGLKAGDGKQYVLHGTQNVNYRARD